MMPELSDIVSFQQKPDPWSSVTTEEIAMVIEVNNYGYRNVEIVAAKANGEEVTLQFGEYAIKDSPELLEKYLNAMKLRQAFSLPMEEKPKKSYDDYAGSFW